MNNFFKIGLIIAFSPIAIIAGVAVYNAITDSTILYSFFLSKQGIFFIPAISVFGFIIMALGSILTTIKWQRGSKDYRQSIQQLQIDYLNDLLKNGANISELERKNIEKKIADLKINYNLNIK